ncbi:MAG: CBS domain-containing protein [Verrucomicrobiales bacterium]|nr:CBS domain-containing protein [Verrucomicrobiales bacterium]
MKRNDPITKIMNAEVITAHHGDPVSKARKLRQEHDVHHLPVVSGTKLVGLVSWSDILRVSFGDAFGTDERAEAVTLDHSMTLEELMTPNPDSIGTHGTVREAAEILASGKFHALPVVNGEELVGMVTTTDLIRYLRDLF